MLFAVLLKKMPQRGKIFSYPEKEGFTMKMHYGSFLHILSIAVAVAGMAGLFLLLRRRSLKTQRAVVFALMLVNVIQHLFKFAIYPQYAGDSFNMINTAYNMCALLILLSPLVYFSKSVFWKDFVFLVGVVAGLMAIAVPIWYVGKDVSELGFGYFRFYLCHFLLFLSSGLTLALGHHRLSYRRCFGIGAAFLLSLLIILCNDALCIILGLAPHQVEDLYSALRTLNPCWSMGPPVDGSFAPVVSLIQIFTLPFLRGENSTGLYAPILWYAIPLYIGITLVAFPVCILVDRKNFLSDRKKRKNSLQTEDNFKNNH